MDNSENDRNQDQEGNVLDLFLFYVIQKIDTNTKRKFLSMFLDKLAEDPQNMFPPPRPGVCIYLSEESKAYLENFLDGVDIVFTNMLDKPQKQIYYNIAGVKLMARIGMIEKGYISFLNACKTLEGLTGLPFSLDEDFGGLSNLDAWDTAVDEAVEKHRQRSE
jgi:hypothetical protein